MPSIPPVESVRRSFAILEALGTAPALGVKQVAERTNLTPSTAHRLLITLVGCGYVMQDARIADSPDVLEYFEQATPASEFDLAKIGSRPARRSAAKGLGDLRAIPWVFGWMQSRHGLPGWFGIGYALERFSDQSLLRRMFASDPTLPRGGSVSFSKTAR